ncbi:hypothetical protein NA57DRAFT_16145, partial [Rhizodiscina lignyota]
NVEEPPLRELNAALRVLVEIFPNVQPEVFREMLSNISEESRLQIVTENLLKNEGQWVRGRLRISARPDPARPSTPRTSQETWSHSILSTEDRFRSLSYRTAVSEALSQEFKGLSQSAIRAVLAESNHSYSRARSILLDISAKSWRFSFTRFIFRRKTPTSTDHPLIAWESCRVGTTSVIQPTLRFTPSTELNLELWNTLVQPVLDKQKFDRERQDWEYSKKINEDQAQELNELYDCECCFIPYAMEHLAACTDGCHYICYTCIRRTINEAIFGQGWAKSMDHEKCTVKCIAPTSGDGHCEGFIPAIMVQQAIEEEPDGVDIWAKVHERCAAEALIKSRMPLIRCPFCVYAELDDFAVRKFRWKFRPLPMLMLGLFFATSSAFILRFVSLRHVVQRILAPILLLLAFNWACSYPLPGKGLIKESVLRVARKRRGLKFTCLSPRCGRSSCLNCHKPWNDIHICFESSKLALRAAVEAATTDAIKRTCPVCSLSFVKAAGCNKLTCVCGYTMCYVCRQEIGKESYTHFCQHFRQRPGEPCHECERCDLYKVEDEDELVRQAALRAEREWWD